MKQPFSNISDPGKLIKDELKERGISQKEFAKAVGVGQSHLSDILSGRRRITLSFAIKTEELLGFSSHSLMGLQTANDIANKENSVSNPELEAKLAIEEIDRVVSVKTLLKFAKSKLKTNTDKLNLLCNLYGLGKDASEYVEKLSTGCYRKSACTGMDKIMISTWVIMAYAVSRTITPAGKFELDRMPEACNHVASALHENAPNIMFNLQRLLSDYGIGLLRVDKVERASIDGYSFFRAGIPYIALTCRYDRIDNLAFTIMHELGHIALGHTNESHSQLNLDIRSYDEEYEDKLENEANRFASDILIPMDLWQFAPTMVWNPIVIQSRYTKWARSKRLNPWIVLGRLSYETGIYKFCSDESRKINGGKEVCHELKA
ncbi:MAG: HigA family addiction module antidote protein [Bacteroides sp.]|nr:HigA family addiction module antidote protein [Bacteroides sp.]